MLYYFFLMIRSRPLKSEGGAKRYGLVFRGATWVGQPYLAARALQMSPTRA